MSFGKPSLGLRLAFWYAALFSAGSGLALTLSYALTARALRARDRAAILDKLGELQTEYRAHGRAGLELEAARPAGRPRGPYVVRLCKAEGKTLLLEMPPDIEGFDAAVLGSQPCPAEGWTVLRSAAEGGELELASAELADGARLQVGLRGDEREDLLERLRAVGLLTLLPAFLLAGGAGYVLARRTLAPLRALLAAAAAIEAGDMSARVPAGGGSDELDSLSQLFNRMLDRIARLIAGMRESLDAIAHDLRTPASRLRVAAEAALSAPPDSAADRTALSECLEESQRVCATLDTLLDLAEAEAGALRPRTQPMKVRALMEESAELYRLAAEESGRTLELECPEGLAVLADPARLRRILANLLDNAVKYGGSDGRIRLSARDENGTVAIVVEDEGPGIAAEDLPRLFDRLYRSERDRAKPGLGLGLSLVKALVEAQGGTVEAANAAGRGTRFIVRLPSSG